MMRTIDDIKNFKYDRNKMIWIDEKGRDLKIVWTENDGKSNIEHTIFEKIEPCEIDGVVYTHITYVYEQGLVLVNDSQRNKIKISELIVENNEKSNTSNIQQTKSDFNFKDVKYTEIYNDIISSVYKFNNNSIIQLHGISYQVTLKEVKHLSTIDIETTYGGWAIEDEETKKNFSTEYIYSYKIV